MNSEERVKRSYTSPLRQGQAEATRRAIVSAAAQLFSERGYVATSIDEIAASAGVSRATVFKAVGGKTELLIQAYRRAVRGEDERTPLGQQERSLRILAEQDPDRLLAGFVDVIAEIAPRLAPLQEALRAAAHADPEAGKLWQLLKDERRFGARRVVRALEGLGALRPGLDRNTATDVLWLLDDVGLYRHLVHERGWSVRRYRRWLTETLQAQLLAPSSGAESES